MNYNKLRKTAIILSSCGRFVEGFIERDVADDPHKIVTKFNELTDNGINVWRAVRPGIESNNLTDEFMTRPGMTPAINYLTGLGMEPSVH